MFAEQPCPDILSRECAIDPQPWWVDRVFSIRVREDFLKCILALFVGTHNCPIQLVIIIFVPVAGLSLAMTMPNALGKNCATIGFRMECIGSLASRRKTGILKHNS